jgi:hypothetical protein
MIRVMFRFETQDGIQHRDLVANSYALKVCAFHTKLLASLQSNVDTPVRVRILELDPAFLAVEMRDTL